MQVVQQDYSGRPWVVQVRERDGKLLPDERPAHSSRSSNGYEAAGIHRSLSCRHRSAWLLSATCCPGHSVKTDQPFDSPGGFHRKCVEQAYAWRHAGTHPVANLMPKTGTTGQGNRIPPATNAKDTDSFGPTGDSLTIARVLTRLLQRFPPLPSESLDGHKSERSVFFQSAR